MRLRVRRAQPSPNQLELPLPKQPRLRVRVKQLVLPHVPDVPELPATKSWTAELAAVQSGAMPLDVLIRRHRSLIRQIVTPWVSRCPSDVGVDDLYQEALVEIWQAIKLWDSARGIPLKNYVRIRIRHRLHAYTERLKRGREKDSRFLQQQLVEERVIVAHQSTGERYEAVGDLPFETGQVAKRTAALVVGALPSKQANVVAGILGGESADSVTSRVYGKCKRQRKAALRALAAATALVSSSTAGGPKHLNAQRTEANVTHEIAAEENTFVQAARCRRQRRRIEEVDRSSYLGQGE